MPFTVSAQADLARDRAETLLQRAGLRPFTAREIARRLTWRLARLIVEDLEAASRDRKAEEREAR